MSHHNNSTLTMILGGVDHTQDFQRDKPARRWLKLGLVAVIVVLFAALVWLASIASTRQVNAAGAVQDSVPHYAHIVPADLNAPPARESYVHPY